MHNDDTQTLIWKQIADLQQLAQHLLLTGDYQNLNHVLATINAYQELTKPPNPDTITP